MAYDETFQALPRFTPEEVAGVSVPEVMFGQIRPLKNILRLAKVRTSPEIEKLVLVQAENGRNIIVRSSLTFMKDSKRHAVGWVGEHNCQHQIVCDCIKDYDYDLEAFGENMLECSPSHEAIRERGTTFGRALSNEDLLHKRGDYETIKNMVLFLLRYSQENPDVWVASHRSGKALIGGFAQGFGRPYEETEEMMEAMVEEKLVTLSGYGNQVISLPLAA